MGFSPPSISGLFPRGYGCRTLLGWTLSPRLWAKSGLPRAPRTPSSRPLVGSTTADLGQKGNCSCLNFDIEPGAPNPFGETCSPVVKLAYLCTWEAAGLSRGPGEESCGNWRKVCNCLGWWLITPPERTATNAPLTPGAARAGNHTELFRWALPGRSQTLDSRPKQMSRSPLLT